MYTLLAKTLFRMWPFPYGHVTVMNALRPAPLPAGDVTTKLKRYGALFRYDPNTYIGQFLYYRGIYEEQILRTIEDCLRPGMTFVDVGANVGLHSVVAAHLVGPRGKVIAFEPGSTMRARAEQNFMLNRLRNVDLRPYALGQSPAHANLYWLDEGNDGESTLAKPSNECRSESVEIRTLDDELQGLGNCVVKIDVEGAEMGVLRGAARFVREAKPKAIFVECFDAHLRRFGASRDEVFRWLAEAGYDIRVLVRGSWMRACEPVDGDLMAVPIK